MLSLSGHKLHAPKGVGALYVRRGVRLRPLLRGGHQERGRRAGTENAAGIVGLGRAAELALEHMDDENTRVRALRDRLEQGLLQRIGNAIVTGDPKTACPTPANIAFEYHRGRRHPAAAEQGRHRLLVRLGLHVGFAGAVACAARDEHPLHRGAWRDPLFVLARQHRSRTWTACWR